MKLLYPFAKRFIAGHDFDSAKPNIKKLRESIVESMFVADLVQMERNILDNEKVFTIFFLVLLRPEKVFFIKLNIAI